MILHSFLVQEREEKMNVRKINTNEFRKRKLERSYISVYIVIKSIAVETENRRNGYTSK